MYDLIVGVVDYTNYLILGVTVALAWELPSKPPSEILDQLKERLKDGTLGTTRNDTISHITYMDGGQIPTPTNTEWLNRMHPAQPHLNHSINGVKSPVSSFHPPIHYSYYVAPSNENFYRSRSSPQLHAWPSTDQQTWKWSQTAAMPNVPTKYPWWSITNR